MSAQRVPAWKRLGLKLKGAESDGSPALPTNGTPSQSSRPNAANAHASPANGTPTRTPSKRNLTPSAYPNSSHTSPYQQHANKRLRTGGPSFDSARDTSTIRRQKSVTFASDSKPYSAGQSQAADRKNTAKAKNKKKKKPKAPAEPAPEFDLAPALAYLRQWATARDSWKFNKNHQTLLIKYLFDGTPRVPSADLSPFLDYIRDLKGGIRSRLRETASELRKTDMEKGAAAFPAETKDREDKQRRYEEVIGRFLEEQKEARQQRKDKQQSTSASNGSAGSKRSFDEVEFVLRTAEPDLKQRLIKRIRAELVLEELSGSEESTASADTTATASSTQDGTVADDEMDVDAKNPAAGLPTKRKRMRNVRTTNVQLSSSESETDSSGNEEEKEDSSDDDSSDSSSSSSSDNEDDESEDQEMQEAGGVESSSSSSSSSSSEEAEGSSESGSEDDSDED